MNEHPILFSAPMVKAILEGRKTQTRRVCKVQPPAWTDRVDAAPLVDGVHRHGEAGQWVAVSNEFVNVRCIGRCPYGEAGDRLWVRETWNGNPDLGIPYAYKASNPELDGAPWRPSIHMPRKASRITLEVVSVRVERVQDISGEDCVAEGIDCLYEPDTNVPADHYNRQSFATLWNSINAKRGYGWDANPWVWVIEFKKVQS